MMLKKSIVFFSVLTLAFSMFSCEEDNSSDSQAVNYIGLENYKTVELNDGETVVVEGRILASNVASEDRTYSLVADASTTHGAANYSLPATVTIPAGSKEGIYEVTIVGNSLVDGNKIVVRLQQEDGLNQSTTFTSWDPITNTFTGLTTATSTFNLYRPCASVRARLSITFDNYPEETAWELYDSALNLIDSGGFNADGSAITGYAALGFADRSTFSVVKCLAPGEYTFVIYDDYGDGMVTSSTIIGAYSMNNLNNGASLFSATGDFGSFSEHTFTIQ